jgi:hypothetical protein
MTATTAAELMAGHPWPAVRSAESLKQILGDPDGAGHDGEGGLTAHALRSPGE